MNRMILLAGAAALSVIAAPSFAKPGGGHGGGMGNGHAMAAAHGPSVHANGNARIAHGKAVHANKHATMARHNRAIRNDRDHDGIDDRDEALARKYGGALCPPGLYKKTPSCVPPGQAKRVFRDGQRVPDNYRYYTPYGDIPAALVTKYGLTDQYRYIYRNNTIYVVDPRTSLVERIISAIL